MLHEFVERVVQASCHDLVLHAQLVVLAIVV